MFRKLQTPMSCTYSVKGNSLMEPCSGRGICLKGTCLCEIRYSGDECNDYNIPYHASVSSVFYFVAALSIIQLFICCKSEYKRLKQPSLLQAIRITTQKLLYFVVFIAASLRGAYFTTPEGLQPKWVLSAYYPLLLTCSSLVTCSWAEIFHLRNIRAKQFLSKSFLGFLAFNILPYSLFGAEILSTHVSNKTDLYASVFSGCYAFLLLIVLIFFLIYGVEVFFKIRGEFLYDCNVYQANRTLKSSRKQNAKDINMVQVSHARFGLLSQAGIMVIIVVFLASDSFGNFWKSKVDITTRNWHHFRYETLHYLSGSKSNGIFSSRPQN
ncbi:uncharacterized protein LOC116346426 isoform X2 [Contarinia nasturtii]|nr:uncharacterized protein LOC116346426 isoform X2 [Contarinia nasturtii]